MLKTEIYKIEKISFFVWPIIAATLSFLIEATFFTSMILFFGIPSIYLSIRNKKLVGKIFVFSIGALIIGIVIDYISVVSSIWFVPFPSLGYMFLGIVSLDMMLWFFLYTYVVVSYYEYFLEHKVKDSLYKPKLKYFYLLAIFLFSTFVIIYLSNKTLLNIPYFFLTMGIILGITPIILVLFKFPSVIIKFTKVGAYFFYFTLTYELTALSLNQWSYPGQHFIGIVTLLGLSFPIEELLFWIILGGFSILSYYEYFDDDQK